MQVNSYHGPVHSHLFYDDSSIERYVLSVISYSCIIIQFTAVHLGLFIFTYFSIKLLILSVRLLMGYHALCEIL